MRTEIRALVSDLMKRTESGKLKWGKMSREGYFSCKVDDFNIFVYPTPSYRVHDSVVMVLRITDSSGTCIDEINDIELESIEPSDDKNPVRIVNLSAMARRSTVNALEVVKFLHSALR